MPKPRRGETRRDFVGRCIPEVIRDGTAKDGSQANAICNSIWRRRDQGSESKSTSKGGQALSFLTKHKLWKAYMHAATSLPTEVPLLPHGPAGDAVRHAGGHYIDAGDISALESLVTSDLVPRSFTALAGGQIRTAQFDGRKHLVVPVVMLLGDAVLRPMHSSSPEFVPAELLAEAPSQWDGRPIVAVHPHQGRGSANQPRTLEAMKFGTIFHTKFKSNSLQAEAWIDPARAEKLGGDALDTTRRLSRGERIEVSVGAWVALAEESGVSPSGARYGARWASLASDHLAFGLAGHEGACSVDMGCGAPRAAQADDTAAVSQTRAAAQHQARTSARRPSFSGTETSSWSRPTFADYVKAFHKGANPPRTISSASAALRRTIASKSLLGNPSADNFRDLSFFPVVNPRTNNLNEGALRAVLGGRGAQATIPAPARESARRMARRLLNSHFGAEIPVRPSASAERKNRGSAAEEDNMEAKTSSEKGFLGKILEALGFRVAQEEATDSEIHRAVWNKLRSMEPAFDGIFEISQSGGWVVYAVSPDGDHKLLRREFDIDDDGNIDFAGDAEEVIIRRRFEPLEGGNDDQDGDAESVESLVDTLIDDATTPYTSDDREALSSFSAERLQQLIEHLEAGPEGASDDNDGGTDSGDSGATAAGSCGCQGTCSCSHNDESDPASAQQGEQEASDVSNDAPHTRSEQSTGAGDSSAAPKHKEVTAMSDTKQHPKAEFMGATKKELVNLIVASKESPFTEADWDVLADFEEPRLRSLLEHYTPEPQPQTEDEWLDSAPDSVKNLVRRHQAEEAEQRMNLISNLKVSQDVYTLEQLKAKPTTELEALAKVLKLDRPRVDFSLRGGSPLRPEDYPSDPPNPYEAGLEKLRAKLN